MLRALALALLLAFGLAHAQDKAPTVRPEVGKPLQAAIDLLKQKKGREALAQARAAQAVSNKTPYESYVVERVLGQAAAAAGDNATAAAAFENAANAAAAPAADRVQLLGAAAGLHYALKDYAKAAATARAATNSSAAWSTTASAPAS